MIIKSNAFIIALDDPDPRLPRGAGADDQSEEGDLTRIPTGPSGFAWTSR
jgi:hypothetical protein